MVAETIFFEKVKESLNRIYGGEISDNLIQVQKTRKEFEGDYTLVTFPLLKTSKKSPEETAKVVGAQILLDHPDLVSGYNVVKGFLNVSFYDSFWCNRLELISSTENYGKHPKTGKKYLLEYSSPNTNKPLHLGHIRNNFLGWSVANILDLCGHDVVRVNLINDRGIHICKSMLAWQKFGNGETPATSGKKGDHLVGDYYVLFDKEYKKQIAELVAKGMDAKEAEAKAPMLLEAKQMLVDWEAKKPEVIELWEMMNSWVYEGFDETYKRLGVSFDKIYYESNTYISGKNIVDKGLSDGVFYKKEDGSVWVDLTAEGLDEKLLLRADGTSVYMTQDIGTAVQRHSEFNFDNMIYVVGNEQNYHFQVLKVILTKLGYDWGKLIYHLSYGMVELPEGKMKSREGTVVDADDLMDEMLVTAREMSEELGKLEGVSEEGKIEISTMVGMGALKYFLLKVDPKKTMLFDPKETIDFNGHTGPFIQYAHARIKSVLRKTEEDYSTLKDCELDAKELGLIKSIEDYPSIVKQAGENYSPALIANYVFDLAKEYNQFYHDHQILREENEDVRKVRLAISSMVATIINSGMGLLGISVPEKM